MGIKSDGNNLLMLLIVGANGWIGSEIRRQLLETKTDFVTANRIDIDSKSFWKSFVEVKSKNDLTVINLAAPGLTTESQDTYVKSTETIARWVTHLNFRSIHVGSAAEFGFGDGLIGEDAPRHPATPYGVLKARTSDIASSSGACVVRPFNVVGKNQPITTPVGEWLSFVKSAPLEGATLTLLNGGLIRDFVSLPFVAQVILHLSTSEIQTDSVNVCTGNGISFLEMAQHLISVSGKSIAIHDAGVGQISKVIGNPMKVGRLGFQEVSNSQNLAELIYAR